LQSIIASGERSRKKEITVHPVCVLSFISICLWFPITAFAGGGPSSEEQYPLSLGPITTWTATLCGKGEFVVQPFIFYNRTRGFFNFQGDYDSLPKGERKYEIQEQVFLQYGISDDLEIDGQTIYQEHYREESGRKAHSDGFGDSYLFLRYCLLKEKGWNPQVTGHIQLKLPTGKYQHADPEKLGTDIMGATSGGGSWDPGFCLNGSKKVRSFSFHADLIWSFPQQVRVDGITVNYANYLNYDVAMEYFLPHGFNLMVETNGFRQGNRKENDSKVRHSKICYLMGVTGIGWSCKVLQTLLAYQRAVTGTNTDAIDSAILSCVYTF
jgi:hypothetical protein